MKRTFKVWADITPRGRLIYAFPGPRSHQCETPGHKIVRATLTLSPPSPKGRKKNRRKM